MENKIDFIEPLFESAKDYGTTSYELIKLKAVDKTADVVSTFISRGAVVFVLSMFMIIANFGLALWIGDLLGKTYFGFFCVAGFYLLAGALLYFFMHKKIKKHVSDSIILQMLN